MIRYYTWAHQEALRRDRQDALSAVIAPDASFWVNRFTDHAHREGMKKVFGALEAEWGSLARRSVLDLGCGCGRRAKEYAACGAVVTGVGISREAINILAVEMPQHRFIAQDVTALTFPDESFDVVNSVTVLQLMPHWKQRIALSLAARWVKRGGYLVLFENILGFDAPHVFPHRTNEWIEMAEGNGLKRVFSWGSNFEVLFRIEGSISQLLRRKGASGGSAVPSTSLPEKLSLKRRMKAGTGTMLAIASFPFEWACQKLPLATPTLSVMIFSKQASP
jgi:SAM-dependent methyltransferase